MKKVFTSLIYGIFLLAIICFLLHTQEIINVKSLLKKITGTEELEGTHKRETSNKPTISLKNNVKKKSIKTVTFKKYVVEDKFGVPTPKTILSNVKKYYDRSFKIIQKDSFDNATKFSFYYEYDQKQRLKRVSTDHGFHSELFYKNGVKSILDEFKNGQLTKKIIFMEDEENEVGELGDYIVKKIYNKNGDLITYQTKYSHFYTYHRDGKEEYSSYITYYNWDKNKNLLSSSMKEITSDNQLIEDLCCFEKVINNILVEISIRTETQFDGLNPSFNEQRKSERTILSKKLANSKKDFQPYENIIYNFKYKFDQENNWIEEITYKGIHPIFSRTRKIEYY